MSRFLAVEFAGASSESSAAVVTEFIFSSLIEHAQWMLGGESALKLHIETTITHMNGSTVKCYLIVGIDIWPSIEEYSGVHY